MVSAVLTLSLALMAHEPGVIPERYQGKEVPLNWRAPTGFREKVVALTIDDGPSVNFTPQILDILEEDHAMATMFLMGRNIRRYPSLVLRERDLGLELGNHTMSHLSMPPVELAAVEVLGVESLLNNIQNKRYPLFRSPYGEHQSSTSLLARSRGMASVLWTIDSHDWEMTNPLQLTNLVVGQMAPGSIILMHDNRPVTVLALRNIIQSYRASGYTFIAVSDMLWRWDNYLKGIPPRP